MMDGILGLLLLWAIGWLLYRAGKRIGSRKGYHVGRSHGRRFRR